MDCRTALATILDSVDYTAGNCRPNEMVGAVLPKEMIVMARQAIAEFDKSIAVSLEIANEVYEQQSGNLTKRAADGCPECGAKFYHAPSCSHFAKNKRVTRRR